MMRKIIGIFVLVSIIAIIQANNSGRKLVSFYDHDANFLGSVACSGEKTLVDTWSQTPAFHHWQAVSNLLFFDRINGKVISNPATALCLKHDNVSIADLSTTGQRSCENSLKLSGEDLLRASNCGAGIMCNVCQFLTQKLIDYAVTATISKCKAYAYKLCDHLPFFGAKCHDLVDKIIERIYHGTDRTSCPICTKLRICTRGECLPNLSALKETTRAICVGKTSQPCYRMTVQPFTEADSCNTDGWTKYLNFYTTHLLVQEAEAFWVGYVSNPWRFAIFEGEYPTDPHPHWKFSFQFWAFKTKMPGTVAYSVGEAGNPKRFMVFQDTNANKNGWTHRFTFWAYPSQLALDRALNL